MTKHALVKKGVLSIRVKCVGVIFQCHVLELAVIVTIKVCKANEEWHPRKVWNTVVLDGAKA
jgi:hypothetical protein